MRRIPENVQPVDNFRLEKYLGQWYEIARLDHSFERGLSRVTATYSLREDGGVRVINRGYSEKEKAMEGSRGPGLFRRRPDQGYLKVSLLRPVLRLLRRVRARPGALPVFRGVGAGQVLPVDTRAQGADQPRS